MVYSGLEPLYWLWSPLMGLKRRRTKAREGTEERHRKEGPQVRALTSQITPYRVAIAAIGKDTSKVSIALGYIPYGWHTPRNSPLKVSVAPRDVIACNERYTELALAGAVSPFIHRYVIHWAVHL